jgi:hypothetical protein
MPRQVGRLQRLLAGAGPAKLPAKFRNLMRRKEWQQCAQSRTFGSTACNSRGSDFIQSAR